MARHHFRSQPALQRSGGRTSFAILLWCLVAGIALGAGGLVSTLFSGLAPDPGNIQTDAPPSELTRPPQDAPLADHAPAESRPATVQAAAEPQASPPPIARSKPQTVVRASVRAKPPHYPVLKPITPQELQERQQLDYQRARDVYDANERTEGYRWAQQNKVRVQRFCRVAEQRTPAFMEGCMNYLRPLGTKGADKPRDPASPHPSDQG
ncbi:MAG: hypothetical protein JWQ97_2474 [Phenylobacterium sp.]|nr:hypothetical protein [Phenylobacterium sp.]